MVCFFEYVWRFNSCIIGVKNTFCPNIIICEWSDKINEYAFILIFGQVMRVSTVITPHTQH